MRACSDSAERGRYFNRLVIGRKVSHVIAPLSACLVRRGLRRRGGLSDRPVRSNQVPALQTQPFCVTGCIGVSVTPDRQRITRPANTTGLSETFTVQNTGQETTTYTISCSSSSPVTCTGVSNSSLTLSPGQSLDVSATYNTGAPGTGSLVLTAASGGVSDKGSYTITVS